MPHVPDVEEMHCVRYAKDKLNRKAFCSCGHAISLPLSQSRNAQVVMIMNKHLDRHRPGQIAKRSAEYLRVREVMDRFFPQQERD